MSADNILLIVEHKGKVRVFDVNFSDITSHEAWTSSPSTAQYEALRDYITDKSYNWEVWSGDSEQGAVNACRRHMRNHVVEYDYTNLIPRAARA